MHLSPRTRRLTGLLQLVGLLVSMGVGLQVSQCPPGMDMPISADGGHSGPLDCPFSGSADEQGDMSCPLAVGGLGPCGTSAVARTEHALTLSLGVPQALPELAGDSARLDGFRAIHLPPPRV